MDIIQKIMQKIAEAKTSGNAILNLGNEEKLRQIKESRIHGTTILALKCENGVIMAADRRCSAGGKIFSDRAIKIEEIGSLSAIGGAGFVSDCQWLVKALKNEFLPNFEKFLEIEQIANTINKKKALELSPWYWEHNDGTVKIAPAFLLEFTEFVKGYRCGNVGISPKHSLAVVNYGGTAREIKSLAENMQKKVFELFGVRLVPEVTYIGFPA